MPGRPTPPPATPTDMLLLLLSRCPLSEELESCEGQRSLEFADSVERGRAVGRALQVREREMGREREREEVSLALRFYRIL